MLILIDRHIGYIQNSPKDQRTPPCYALQVCQRITTVMKTPKPMLSPCEDSERKKIPAFFAKYVHNKGLRNGRHQRASDFKFLHRGRYFCFCTNICLFTFNIVIHHSFASLCYCDLSGRSPSCSCCRRNREM